MAHVLFLSRVHVAIFLGESCALDWPQTRPPSHGAKANWESFPVQKKWVSKVQVVAWVGEIDNKKNINPKFADLFRNQIEPIYTPEV